MLKLQKRAGRVEKVLKYCGLDKIKLYIEFQMLISIFLFSLWKFYNLYGYFIRILVLLNR